MVECANADCGGTCLEDRPPRVEEKTLCCDGAWTYTEWTGWTGTCGKAYRFRKPVSCSCEGQCGELDLVQEKPLAPCCVPDFGEYTYGEWGEWSTECNYGERHREVLDCSANECGFCGTPITSQQRLRPCDDDTVCPEITLGPWSQWNGTCGAISRVRSYENCEEECKELCEEPCYKEELWAGPCCVPTNGYWEYTEWSAWESACLGFQTRSRVAVSCNATCDGLCGPTYTHQVSAEPSGPVQWVYGEWSEWSGQCGRVHRYRTALYCPSACSKSCGEKVTSQTQELGACCEPQPGTWDCSSWSEWSDTCTTQSRHRTCGACLSVCDGPCPDKEVYQERESTKICPGDGRSANEDTGSGTNNIDEVAGSDGDDFLGPLLIALVAAAMLLLLLGAAYARTKKRNAARAAAAAGGADAGSPGSGRRPNLASLANSTRDPSMAGSGPVAPVKNPVFGADGSGNPNYVPDFMHNNLGSMANPNYA